jgi:hypothetical protein
MKSFFRLPERLLLFILLLLANSLHTPGFAQEKQERKLGNFSKIEVSNAITLQLSQGNTQSVVVEANSADQDKIITEVSGDELIVRRDNRHKNQWSDDKIIVHVTVKALSQLDMSSASRVKGETPIQSDNFSLRMSEASHLELDLAARTVKVNMHSASRANLKLEADEIRGNVSEASHLSLVGKVENELIEPDSAGSVKVMTTSK